MNRNKGSLCYRNSTSVKTVQGYSHEPSFIFSVFLPREQIHMNVIFFIFDEC